MYIMVIQLLYYNAHVSNFAQASVKMDMTCSSSMYTLSQNTEFLILLYTRSWALRFALSVDSLSRPNICRTISLSGWFMYSTHWGEREREEVFNEGGEKNNALIETSNHHHTYILVNFFLHEYVLKCSKSRWDDIIVSNSYHIYHYCSSSPPMSSSLPSVLTSRYSTPDSTCMILSTTLLRESVSLVLWDCWIRLYRILPWGKKERRGGGREGGKRGWTCAIIN